MSTPPSTPVLPRHIDPRKFAQQGIAVTGKIELPLLTRLTPLLASDQGDISVDLDFGVDEQGVRCVTGMASAQVFMVCQRCLDEAPQQLQAQLNLGMVWSDDNAKQLPKHLDPWVVGEGQTDIYSVIEDELILSLPIVAYHDHACVAETAYSAGEDKSVEPTTKNPFQVLASLKQSVKSSPDSNETDK